MENIYTHGQGSIFLVGIQPIKKRKRKPFVSIGTVKADRYKEQRRKRHAKNPAELQSRRFSNLYSCCMDICPSTDSFLIRSLLVWANTGVLSRLLFVKEKGD